VTAVLQCACTAGLVKVAAQNANRNYLQTGIFAAIIILCVAWHNEQFIPKVFPNEKAEGLIKEHRKIRSERFYVYQVSNEMMPIYAKVGIRRARGKTPLIQVSSPHCKLEKHPDCAPHFIHFSISTPKPMKALINQLYFPGQQIILNGVPFSREQKEKYITQDGRTFIDIPAGANQELIVFYEGPPGWRLRNILIGIILIGYILFIYKESRKKTDESATHGQQ
jgi:hypothetical protein